MELLNFYIFDPLSYDFMQRALAVSMMIGFSCSIFSCFLILKGWSLMGDAVSHAVLPGLGIAYILNIPLSIGAFIAGLFCAITTGFIRNNSRVKEDAVMGIMFSGMFAFGLVLLSRIETDVHLLHVLFGNVLGITQYDLIETFIISGFSSLVLIVKRRDFMLYCFDPDYARVIGLPVKLLHFLLLALLSLTIVSALKAAGIILVIAMLIAPGAIGFLMARSFGMMMMIAICVSVFSCAIGTILSFHLDAATAPFIVVIQGSLFLSVLLYKGFKSEKVISQICAE
ncbi:MAG: metal ABC transporter permease [Alphaproteobacteria bacterium]